MRTITSNFLLQSKCATEYNMCLCMCHNIYSHLLCQIFQFHWISICVYLCVSVYTATHLCLGRTGADACACACGMCGESVPLFYCLAWMMTKTIFQVSYSCPNPRLVDVTTIIIHLELTVLSTGWRYGQEQGQGQGHIVNIQVVASEFLKRIITSVAKRFIYLQQFLRIENASFITQSYVYFSSVAATRRLNEFHIFDSIFCFSDVHGALFSLHRNNRIQNFCRNKMYEYFISQIWIRRIFSIKSDFNCSFWDFFFPLCNVSRQYSAYLLTWAIFAYFQSSSKKLLET